MCAAAALLAPGAAAQCPTSFLFTGSTQFGKALDVSGDRLVLGDGSTGFGGVAIVMQRAPWGWTSEASLFSSAPEGNGLFGDAVAISGDWVAVGAPGELGGAGAVHLFHRSCSEGAPCAWVWVARLTPAEAVAGDRFGGAIALDGGRLLVAATGSDLAAPEAGALFVFEEAGGAWSEAQVLTAGEGATPYAALGACVALGGGVAVAGSPVTNRAWVFQAGGGPGGGSGGFGAAQALSQVDAGEFGASVATDGARVAVGAPGSSVTAIKSGAAFVFEPVAAGSGSGTTGGIDGVESGGSTSWTMMDALAPSGSTLFAGFGSSVAIDGPTLAVGAKGMNAGHGSLQVLRLQPEGWTPIASFDDLPGPDSLGLGAAAAIGGDTLLGGARAFLGPPGVVYTFGGVAPWSALGGGLAGSTGLPVLAIDGSLCGGDSLELTISHGKPNAPALLLVGLEARPQAWKGGVLWPQPDVIVPALLGASGAATRTLYLPVGLPGGQPVYAQAWIADPAGPAGVSATPAATAKTP